MRVGDVAGDAEAGGGVLDVGDDEVDATSRSTSAGTARRAISRPGLPKMSPMNRMRTSVGPDGDADLAAAPLVDARQRDAQLAARAAWRRRGRRRRRPRAGRAREAPERALGEVKRGAAVLARGGSLLAGDHAACRARTTTVTASTATPGRSMTTSIAVGRFDDVERRACTRAATPCPSASRSNDPPEVVVGQ